MSSPTQWRPGPSRVGDQLPSPSPDATNNKSLVAGMDDSTVYNEKDKLEESILLSNTDLRPTAASKRPIEEIARVYAEVRRLRAVVQNRDQTIADTLDLAQDWERTYDNGQRAIETQPDDVGEAMASLMKERDGLADALHSTREELRLNTETNDLRIASLESLVDAQEKNIAQHINEAQKIPTPPRHDPENESSQASTIQRLEIQLTAEKVKARMAGERLKTYTETQGKRVEELKTALQELRAANMAATEKLAERDEQLLKLNKTVADLKNALQAATATVTTTRNGEAMDVRNSGNAVGPPTDTDGGGPHSGPTIGSRSVPSDGSRDGLRGGSRSKHGSEQESDHEHTGDSTGLTPPFRGSLPKITSLDERQFVTTQTVYMNWAGREIQTDIEIPPGEERPVIGCVAWLQDPTLAAINELKQQIPEAVQEVATKDVDCQTAGGWARLQTTVEEDERRQLVEGKYYGKDEAEFHETQVEAKDHETEAEAIDHEARGGAGSRETQTGKEGRESQEGPGRPLLTDFAPFAVNYYQELITTDTATRAKLKDLTTKPHLTLADHDFLANFVMAQSTSPSREILDSVWRLAQPAARAVRMAASKTYDGPSTADDIFTFHRMHGPIGILAWPVQLLCDSFQGLDRADYYASTNIRGEEGHPDSKSFAEASRSPNPKHKRNPAPRGTQAALLRAGPRPGVAWSILTAGLYLFILVLIMSNIHMYRRMKQEEGLWVSANEPSPGRFASPGCWRVGHTDGWGWRWKALIREWITENRKSWPA